MKILFGVQGTGNGHIQRDIEIIEHLQSFGEVEILLSGSESELVLPYPITYKKFGFSFVSQAGTVDFFNSLKNLKIKRLAYDIKTLPLKNYDIIVSDYEPITGWASYFQKKFCVGLSNQVSFFSPHVPRPKRKNVFIEYIIKHFVPSSHRIGFHYESYDDFIETPIIPNVLRTRATSDEGHMCVYLPAYQPLYLKEFFLKIPEIQWHIFSKKIIKPIVEKNVTIEPIGSQYISKILSAHGVISAAGFQATSEALFLGKKLLVVPHLWHYEQECNAAALSKMGIKITKIDTHFTESIRDWLYNEPIIKINYPDNAKRIAEKIILAYHNQ